MSAIEFSLASQRPFLVPLPEASFEQHLTGAETLTERYESLSQLSRSIASMTLDDISRNLVALVRPIFACDLANILLFTQDANGVPWRSLGATQLAPSHSSIDETTVWSTDQKQKALWIADVQTDEELLADKETQSILGARYRSFCRLPLLTPQGCLGVLSLANAGPHSYSEQERRLLCLAADQVALGLSNSLLHAELQKLKSEFSEEEGYVEQEQHSEPSFEAIVGRSPALQRVLREVEVVAPTDSGVLIQGETGTGKDRPGHSQSKRAL
jgi:formate hydrogenlyase transcriptional activator